MAETARRRKKVKRFYDYSLLAVIIFLCVFGLIIVYSSSSYSAELKIGDSLYYFKRQGVILAGSFVGMLMVSKMDYHKYAKLAALAYLVALVLMILTNFTPLGIEHNGQKRWFGTESLSFQPAEFVKIAIILTLSTLISKIGRKIDTWRGLLLAIVLSIPLFLLVAMNNLSSGIIIAGICFLICFVGSKNKGIYLFGVVAVLAVAFVFVQFGEKMVEVGILEGYQLERIRVWQNPEAYPQDGGWQVLQGLYAIGSGGLFGRGLGQSIQKLGFIPEAMNDMVFSIICEELGLFGALCVILLFLFMVWRFMVIANNAPDLLGALIVVGVMAHISIQVILNVAVVTNTIPNTGISLPFISYGGTSILFLMAEMGMVLGVSNRIPLE
ncbi:MAG: FtsW/RodA/SpoVE family cell cycle protein [Lachnospiraceae bacterium]|nr:FtsW/RodA/SpoVE family cell cycle protein [Lachnospiraceae bacterium]